MLLIVNSAAHFLVDALCVTTLLSAGAEGAALTAAVVVYNCLAFGTQCLAGLLLDRVRHETAWNSAAMVLTALGFAMPLPFFARVVMVGAGNSLFHVAGGVMTLRESRGRAWQLGVFVAPGALGVTLGMTAPRFGWVLAALLVLAAVLVPWLAARTPRTLEYDHAAEHGLTELPLAAVLLLTAAVAVRAVGGAAVRFPWKSGAGAAWLMTAFVAAGKAAGGFVCDRLGARRTAWVSIPLAAVCIAFFAAYPAPSLIGQLLLNLTMPVTLWLLYRAMPDQPGFAFGLAASALWPGTIAGLLLRLTGPALWACVLASFLFGLFAVLYSVRAIKRAGGSAG